MRQHWRQRDWFRTLVFTVSVDSIAMMPCNPNIGGSSKGHLVKRARCLGGGDGKGHRPYIYPVKMLNKSHGSWAVHSLRAQADKAVYSRTMRRVLEAPGEPGDQTGRGCQSPYWKMERSRECSIFRCNISL